MPARKYIYNVYGYFLAILSVLSLPAASFSQADSIMSLAKEKQYTALWKYFSESSYEGPAQLLRLQKLEKEFTEHGQEDLAFEVWLEILQHTLYSVDSLSHEEKMDVIREEINRARKRKNEIHEAECVMQMGVFNFLTGKYGPGFEWMMKGYEMLKTNGWLNPYRKVQDLESMGHAFFRFGDHVSSIKYMQEAHYVHAPPFHGYPRTGINSIALSYLQLEKYDSAIHYFKKAIELGKEANNPFFVALTQGNLGHVYFKAGKYDEALPLLEADYIGSKAANQMGSAANAAQLLATIALDRGQLSTAEDYIQFSRSHLDTSSVGAMVTFYSNMYTFSRKKNDLSAAVKYADSLKTYEARLDKLVDEKILEQARMSVQMDKYESEVKLLETARSRQVLIRNGLLIIMLLIGLLAITWIRRLQYKQKKEAELTLLKEKNATERLLSAQQELNTYTKALLEKNELLHNFRKELDQLHASGMVSMDERTSAINRLTQSTLLTEEDWRTFRHLFEQVYPGYLTRLKDKFVDLTPAEIRLMALTKLKVSPKEMADMLGISSDSIKKTRYRLRKKINLPEDGTLEEVADMI